MIRHTIYALSLLTALAVPAYASGLTATQSVQRLVVIDGADGAEQVAFLSAENVTPGERVLYTINYVNDSADAASNVRLVMPVPEEIAYIENTATGEDARIAYSVDGGTSFAPRGDLTITIDGVSRMALAEEITHISWTFAAEMAPGIAGEISYLGMVK